MLIGKTPTEKQCQIAMYIIQQCKSRTPNTVNPTQSQSILKSILDDARSEFSPVEDVDIQMAINMIGARHES